MVEEQNQALLVPQEVETSAYLNMAEELHIVEWVDIAVLMFSGNEMHLATTNCLQLADRAS